MKACKVLIPVFLLSSVAVAQEYSIDWYVIASGGGEASSENYSASGTIGQPIVGQASSENYTVDAGFWVGGGPIPCDYVIGDVNTPDASGPYNGIDITYGVNYFKYGEPVPMYDCECPPHGTWYVSGDVNGSCNYNGLDVTYGVNYFKYGESAPFPCPDCPPGGGLITVVEKPDTRPLTVPRVKPVAKTTKGRTPK